VHEQDEVHVSHGVTNPSDSTPDQVGPNQEVDLDAASRFPSIPFLVDFWTLPPTMKCVKWLRRRLRPASQMQINRVNVVARRFVTDRILRVRLTKQSGTKSLILQNALTIPAWLVLPRFVLL
jgi:hypothetical protein